MDSGYDLYLTIGRSLPNAVESSMFGRPCFKINGKAFMSFFDDEVAFKLSGTSHQDALSLDAARAFNPSGKRPLKEWIIMPAVYSDKWSIFAKAAKDYVEHISLSAK